MIAGLLHTVPALAGTFDPMVAEALPGSSRQHVVDAWMLETAIRDGVTPDVQARVAAHLDHLAACGADAVLVTCSSIGEAAEQAGAAMSITVLRVDEPMAAEAARIAGVGESQIAVFSTNTATIGPTTRLIERYVAAQGSHATVSTTVVEGAAAARANGRPAEHDRLIAEAVGLVAGSASVIVLAQASMADAVTGLTIPVLTSPQSGVERLKEVLES